MNDAPNSGADETQGKNTPEVAPVNEHSARLGPGWDLKPSDSAWVSNYPDWRDVWQSLLSPLMGR